MWIGVVEPIRHLIRAVSSTVSESTDAVLVLAPKLITKRAKRLRHGAECSGCSIFAAGES
jgi:hypothetical protein